MKIKISFLIILIFSVVSFSWAQTERFVKQGGTGDGTSWDNPSPDFITAALIPTTNSIINIYVAEGQYGNINFDKDDDTGNESNLPDGIDVNIYGGYPNDLEGTSTCGYDPSTFKTIIEPDGSSDGGESVFRMDDTDGNLTVKGMHFINSRNDNIQLGSVLTIDDADGNMVTFEDIYVNGSNTDPGVGVFHIRDGAKNNTLTINNIIAKNSANTTISTQISTQNNTIIINNGLFTDNIDASGGAILIRSNNPIHNILQVNDSYFCRNRSSQASSGGGAISVQNSSKAEISNSYFIDNESDNNGGAINAITNGEVSSTHNYFRGNTAGGFGGAISTNNGKFLSTGNDIFYQNTASSNGGAIHINGDANLDPNILIENATFIENMATASSSRGGAIFLSGDTWESNPSITGSVFCSNSANDGGSIASIDNNALTIINNTFLENSSNNDGGAIYIFGASQNVPVPAILIDDNNFQNNTTSVRGGAIFAEDTGPSGLGNIEIRNSNFKANIAGPGTSNGLGGAIMFNGPGVSKASGKVTNCKFESNTANLGGAIYSRLDNHIYILNSLFWDNDAWTNGGAIFHAGTGSTNNPPFTSSDGINRSFIVEGSTFHSNSAGFGTNPDTRYGGGAIYDIESSTNAVYIFNSQFYSNEADIGNVGPTAQDNRGGGAIRFRRSALLRNVTFNNNSLNGDINLPENNGGSDVQVYDDETSTFENSKMQMVEGAYANSGWTFDAATTYDQNSVAVPTKPASLTSLTCTQPADLTCRTDTNIFSRNLPTMASLMAECTASEAKISVSLDSLSTEDFPIMYTWISPDPINYPNVTGTANQTSDIDLTGFEKIGEYTLQIMDNQGCKDTVKITMNPAVCSVLPLDLTHFRAKKVKTDVELIWITASELNNSHFNVERSADGISWEKIGEVRGNGTTTAEHQYKFIDKAITESFGTIYYRLNQIDFDGSSDYSDILSIQLINDLDDITIYPNPAKSVVHVSGLSVKNYRLELHNAIGEVVKESHLSTINVSDLQSGLYLIVILDANNNVLTSEKIMITK